MLFCIKMSPVYDSTCNIFAVVMKGTSNAQPLLRGVDGIIMWKQGRPTC